MGMSGLHWECQTPDNISKNGSVYTQTHCKHSRSTFPYVGHPSDPLMVSKLPNEIVFIKNESVRVGTERWIGTATHAL